MEYGFFWVAALANVILYSLIFLCIRGNILVEHRDVTGGCRWGNKRISWLWERQPWTGTSKERRELMVVAKRLLAYPIAYGKVQWPSFFGPYFCSAQASE